MSYVTKRIHIGYINVTINKASLAALTSEAAGRLSLPVVRRFRGFRSLGLGRCNFGELPQFHPLVTYSTAMAEFFMIIGFAMAAYAVVANDSIQALGTISWLFAIPPLCLVILTRRGIPVSTSLLVLTAFNLKR